jgi:hypothetical protein
MSDFNKHVGKFIDKSKAEKLKSNWKKTKIATQSSFVGTDIITELLAKPGAVGLRIFYGVDDDGNMAPVFYAADAEGRVISGTQKSASASLLDDGADASLACPPYCPK